MTAHRIIKNLTRQGNAMLGVGCYSAALAARNGEDAIKIGTNMDDPWLDFKAMVVDVHATNPHIPRIKSFYQDTSNEYYVCVMERLHPVDFYHKAAILIERIEAYVCGWHSDEGFLDILKDYKSNVPHPKQLLEVLRTIKEHTTHHRSGQPVGESTVTFYESDPEDDNVEGRRLDMHRSNFMLRDEVLVIIDPWCNVCMEDIADLSDWAGSNLESKF